jgi:hypothetical protein
MLQHPVAVFKTAVVTNMHFRVPAQQLYLLQLQHVQQSANVAWRRTAEVAFTVGCAEQHFGACVGSY